MTIKEWYQRVRDPVLREKLLKNIDPTFSSYNDLSVKLSDAIGNGFNWVHTIEGFNYWSDINHKAAKNEIELYPKDYGSLPWENISSYRRITELKDEYDGKKVRVFFNNGIKDVDITTGILIKDNSTWYVLHNSNDISHHGNYPSFVKRTDYPHGYQISDFEENKVKNIKLLELLPEFTKFVINDQFSYIKFNENGKAIKVPRTVTKVTRGKEQRGTTISSRRKRVTTTIGYLSNKVISIC